MISKNDWLMTIKLKFSSMKLHCVGQIGVISYDPAEYVPYA